MYFSECRGDTLSSWSAVSTRVAGYWSSSEAGFLILCNGEYLENKPITIHWWSQKPYAQHILHDNVKVFLDIWISVVRSPVISNPKFMETRHIHYATKIQNRQIDFCTTHTKLKLSLLFGSPDHRNGSSEQIWSLVTMNKIVKAWVIKLDHKVLY